MRPNVASSVRLLNRVAFRSAQALLLGAAMLLLAGSNQLQAQDWPGMRTASPRLVAAGPLWITPTVVNGLRPDRSYSIVLTGSIKLGDDHYGRYYKGYYGDGAYRWESRATDINYPTQAPRRSAIVATNLGIRLAEAAYQQNHIYHTDWFTPPNSTMTIQLAARPSPDNRGQIRFSLLELPPNVNPNEYTYNSASGTWYDDTVSFGQPPRGVGLDSLWDAFVATPPQGVRVDGNNGLFSPGGNQPVVWDEPQGVSVDTVQNLFSSDYGQPAGPNTNGGFFTPPFPSDGVLPSFNPAVRPADVDLAPGFTPTAPPQNPNRSTNGGNSIDLLDQIAPPVYY